MNYSLKEILVGLPLLVLFSPIILIIILLLIFDLFGQKSLWLANKIMDLTQPIIERTRDSWWRFIGGDNDSN